jgi:hypothetical protein
MVDRSNAFLLALFFDTIKNYHFPAYFEVKRGPFFLFFVCLAHWLHLAVNYLITGHIIFKAA